MTRGIVGMHLCNSPQQYHIEQMLRAAPNCVTLLHFQLKTDPLINANSDDENCNWFGKLRFGFGPQGIPAGPNRLVHIRMYHPDWRTLDPVRWAEHTVNMLSDWKGSRDHAGLRFNLFDDPLVGISPANEQDIEPNWSPEMQTVAYYTRIAAWNMAWARRVNELVPNRKALLVTSAFAGGHEPYDAAWVYSDARVGPYPPDGEYQIAAARDMLTGGLFDVVGVHAYALLDRKNGMDTVPGGKDQYWYMLRPFRPRNHKNVDDLGGVCSQYPHLRYLISENGTFAHADPGRTDDNSLAHTAFYQAAQAAGNVIGVTPFIWNADDSHPTNRIWPSEPLRNFFEGVGMRTPYYGPDLPSAGWLVAPPASPPPVEEPTVPSASNPYGYNVGPGLESLAAELGWTLLSDELYHDPKTPGGGRTAFSEAFCDRGRLYWHARTGVQAVPFEEAPDHR